MPASRSSSPAVKPARRRAATFSGPRIPPMWVSTSCWNTPSASRPSRAQHHLNQRVPAATWAISSCEDSLQNRDSRLVAGTAQARDHAGRYVQPACFEHARHQGHACETGMGRAYRHVPQTIVRVEVAVGMTEFGQSRGQPPEMARFVDGDSDPVTIVRGRQAAESIDRVPGQIDRVELDMRDCMNQGRASLDRPEATLCKCARRHPARPLRSTRRLAARNGRKRRAQIRADLAGHEAARGLFGQRELVRDHAAVQTAARAGVQRDLRIGGHHERSRGTRIIARMAAPRPWRTPRVGQTLQSSTSSMTDPACDYGHMPGSGPGRNVQPAYRRCDFASSERANSRSAR